MTADPGAAGGGIAGVFARLFGEGSIAQQFLLWGVLQQVAGSLMGPYLQALSNDVNAAHPEMPLALGELTTAVRRGTMSKDAAAHQAAEQGVSADDFDVLLEVTEILLSPADAALAVLRGIMTEAQGVAAAAKAGVTPNTFDILVANTGEPPAPDELLQLWRRGKLDTATLEKGIRQSRVRDEWIPTVKELGVVPPTPSDILNALLQGQTDFATGKSLYEKLGGDPDYFQLMFDSHGNAPTPDEAGVMANRGIIPWTGTGPAAVTFEQAFLEGPWRNKWLDAFRKMVEYLPPPRTVTAMLKNGSLTDDQAHELLMKTGLSDALASAYIADAHITKTTVQRDLTVSQVGTLYKDQAIDHAQGQGMLTDLGYTTADADFILLTYDVARVESALETAIGRVHTRYTGHTIDRTTASNDLDTLGVPSNQRDALLDIWDTEREATVKRLTAAEVKKAMQEGFIKEADAIDRLHAMGYIDPDADIYLQI